jgi:hypothetical protein
MRKTMLSFRVSDGELAAIEFLAAKKSLTISEWLRAQIRGARFRFKLPPAVAAQLQGEFDRRLSTIGRRLKTKQPVA